MNPDQQSLHSDPAAGRFKFASGDSPLNGYTIRRGIGIGGFGEVYFAVSDAGKEVALKRIQRNLDVELRGVQNCLNLKHLNLISLWDIRTDAMGESWVVMEYVPGPSLRDIIEVSERGMPGHQIDRWFDPIASGVAYLHDKGIVHRDLKPANIFLDEDENVIKIGDYGLSKFISCSQGSGQTETVGTFHYMAPEIGKGIYGKGIDIYAMGIVLYEMLTGTVPFRGESSQEIIMKHLTADPNLDGIPFDFREAIRRSLLKDPDARFGSIAELRDYLPWSSKQPTSKILSADRISMRTAWNGNGTPSGSTNITQGRTPSTPANPMPPSRVSMTNILGEMPAEEGIRFGPLQDSTAGSRPTPEILYIEDTMPPASPAAPAPQARPAPPQHAVAASEIASEPIAQAVKSTWGEVEGWWNDHTVSTPLKVFVLLVVGMAITANSEWLLPTALVLAFVYLVYFGVRLMLSQPLADSVVVPPKKLSRREQHTIVQSKLRQQLAEQDVMTRVTSLAGSLLMSAIVCIALNLLSMAILGSVFESAVESWALFGWSTFICVAASWMLLIAGKFYEPSSGDALRRRFTMLAIGLLLGIASFTAGGHLNIDFVSMSEANFNPLHWSQLVVSNTSLLTANLLFFAAVFGALRWWRQTDPTRRTRLSIWSVGLCLIWSALFGHVLDLVPLWNCLLVVVTSVAIQLSSPWITTEHRSAIFETKFKPEA